MANEKVGVDAEFDVDDVPSKGEISSLVERLEVDLSRHEAPHCSADGLTGGNANGLPFCFVVVGDERLEAFEHDTNGKG